MHAANPYVSDLLSLLPHLLLLHLWLSLLCCFYNDFLSSQTLPIHCTWAQAKKKKEEAFG